MVSTSTVPLQVEFTEDQIPLVVVKGLHVENGEMGYPEDMKPN